MTDKDTVYLIDGSSYIFRAYHAIRSLTNSDGFPTNAIYGFTNMLLKFIKDYDPKYIGVVFDSKKENFRHEIYPLYKANRGEPPDDLKPQFNEIFNLVKAFNIPMLQEEGFEADDIIGTIAKEFNKHNLNVVIVTGDKDFSQLVSNNITLLDTMRDKLTEVEGVIEKFGVEPDKIIEVFALAGDSIDNIPGVKGIGNKTASALVRDYGSLENIYENIEKLKPRYQELLQTGKEDAFLSRQLVTIKSDINMNIDLNEYEYKGIDKSKLTELFKKYEFSSLLKEIDSNTKILSENSINKNDSEVTYEKYKLVVNEGELEELLKVIKKTGVLSIDLETTSHLPMDAEILGFALCPRPHESYYLPVGHRNLLNAIDQLSAGYVIEKLKPVIEDENIKKIGQNLKYEYIVLSKYDVELRGIYFDTMIAAHLIDSSKNSYSLDELSRIYLGHKTITYKEVTGQGRFKIKFEEADIELVKTYACEDADTAYLLSELLSSQLKDLGLIDIYNDYLLDLIVVLANIEINGVKIDEKKLGILSNELAKIINSIEENIYSESGTKFNINSAPQLRQVLFDRLKLPVKKKTKKGEASTDIEVLTELSRDNKVPKLMLSYRALTKLKSTYIDALPRLINIHTNRIHTSFNQAGTSTGRISSSDPNLQNIPIKSEEGLKIREAFVADKGFLLLSADYSQIELRLVAHFSEDKNLISSFKAGSDIHNKTASEIFGVAQSDITQDMRRLAKNINFGIIYGISAFGLAKQIGASVSTAKDYIDQYFDRYKQVKNYLESSVRIAQQLGYAETLIGRRRYIQELKSNDRSTRGFGERAAINTPIQGSAADIINLAMLNLFRKMNGNYKSRIILQVHDELLFEIDESEQMEVTNLIVNEMESAWKLKVPLTVGVNIGRSWAEVH